MSCNMLHSSLWVRHSLVSSSMKHLVAYSPCLCVYSFPFHICHLHLENELIVEFAGINIVNEHYSSSTPFRTSTQKQRSQTCQVFSHLLIGHYRLKKYLSEPHVIFNDGWAFLFKFFVYLKKKIIQKCQINGLLIVSLGKQQRQEKFT